MTENLRAQEVMGGLQDNQRRAPRKPVNAGGTISSGTTNHVAWIKDLSEDGACLFTKFQPAVGDTLCITLTGSRLPSHLRRVYEGKVVRVHRDSPGAAVSVAILFTMIGTVLLRVA